MATSGRSETDDLPYLLLDARQCRPRRTPHGALEPSTTVVWFEYAEREPCGNLAITVDRDVHARILSAVEAEGSSISAWLTAAARQALRVRDGPAAVAEWEAEHGALTEDELEAARKRVSARKGRSRPKRSAS